MAPTVRRRPRPRSRARLGEALTLLTTAVLAWGAACAPAAPAGDSDDVALPDTPEPPPGGRVRVGIDVLLTDSLGLVRGKRVGLITNQTGLATLRSAAGEDSVVSTVAALHARADVDLVALYSPEHGIAGRLREGEKVPNARDEATGLPVYSLYGDTEQPLPGMLEGIDVLLFDIQDVGARYYTYVWTMALAMRAAASAGTSFVVLDRPNPIGGELVQGNVLDTAFASFVGLYPVPMRHGMTAGEIARLVRARWTPDVDLRVVPMEGWTRSMRYDETGLPWVAPSPNMPSVESASHYPGTCLFEGTGLSVGRGTERPFQWIGAPWVDGAALAERLNAYNLPGVRFEPATFTPVRPSDGKYDGVEVHGVRFVLTDPARYDPTRAATATLIEAHRQAKELPADPWTWNPEHFDRLAGTDRVRRLVDEGWQLNEVVGRWNAQRDSFEVLRRPSLLYR